MDIEPISAVEPADTADFNRLGLIAGLLGSSELMSRHERDGRWSTRYLRCRALDGELLGMVPLYAPRVRAWNGHLFAPSGWGLEDLDAARTRPDRVLLAGGCFGIPTSLHLSSEALGSPSLMAVILKRMEAEAQAQGRILFFPFLPSAERDALDRAAPGRIRWTLFGADAVIRDIAPDWPARLGSRIRHTLRKDAERARRLGMTSGTCRWEEIEDQACALIAAHNLEKGTGEHPEYVRLRYQELAEVRVPCVVFTVRWEGGLALSTALVGNGELLMFEVGLPELPGPDRHAAYIEAAYSEPLRYAREHGLSAVRFGVKSPAPKAARGATFDDVYCGVLVSGV